MKRLAVLDVVRTPQMKSFGQFERLGAVALGQHVCEQLLEQSGIEASQIDEVIFGNVCPPPDAANLARVIALKTGVAESKVAHTVNRNCASGMEAIVAAWHAVEEGRAQLVIAGGTESMSNVPMFVSGSLQRALMQSGRSKKLWHKISPLLKLGRRDWKPIHGLKAGLTDPIHRISMGQTAEILADEFAISREEQDQFARESHAKACTAQQRCFLSGEIAPIEVHGTSLSKDDGPRRPEKLQKLDQLRPIFETDGSVTAGNSCPVTDGASALMLTQRPQEFVDRPLGYIVDYAIAGCDPRRMGLGPVFATAKLLERQKLTLQDIDLFELNEAFAAQVIGCMRAFESKGFAMQYLSRTQPLGVLHPERLNQNGGAIALGHPVGATGARLVLTLLRSLKERGLHRGIATLCVGGGQGVAMLVEAAA